MLIEKACKQDENGFMSYTVLLFRVWKENLFLESAEIAETEKWKCGSSKSIQSFWDFCMRCL